MRITIDYEKYDALCKRHGEPNYIESGSHAGSKQYIQEIFDLMWCGGAFWNRTDIQPSDSDEVEVILSDLNPVWQEDINIDSLKELAVKLQERIDKLPVESKDPGERLLRTQLIFQLRSLKERIEQKKEVLLYGEFVPGKEPKVILYMGNIKHSQELLISTCIHELYHAWNYFCCDRTPRAIPEIDEAMVEYATLLLLDILTSSSYFVRWYYQRNFFDFYLQEVKRKQESIGLLAAYGFGAYLFETDDKDHSVLLAYPTLSGLLSMNNNDVKAAVSLLNPLYPYGKEEETKQHIITALVPAINTQPNVKQGQAGDLFWDIINCGLGEFGKSGPCSSVINSQNAPDIDAFHIPEPWNGNLSTAQILFVSINPGYSPGELYPRTGFPYWMNGSVFDCQKVKDFFERRFDDNLPYVRYRDGGHAFSIGMEPQPNADDFKKVNGYWTYVFKMARVLIPNFDPLKDFAITELVHCKSDNISFLNDKCYDKCMGLHLSRIFEQAGNVKWIIFIGKPVRKHICRHYNLLSPNKYTWYRTDKFNGRETLITFVDHNGYRATGITSPPTYVSKI